MNPNLMARLRRLEAVQKPAMPMRALIVMARDGADAAEQVTEATAAGRHQPGWPAIIVTGSPSFTEGHQA